VQWLTARPAPFVPSLLLLALLFLLKRRPLRVLRLHQPLYGPAVSDRSHPDHLAG
jgi:hypothetical protein